MGQRLLSVKGETGWRGKSTQSVSDRGQRRFLKLENCYVSADGSEIRQFPGYTLLWDGSSANTFGYAGYAVDAVKPIFETTPSETYQLLSYQETARLLKMRARAKPVHFHGFEQVGDTTVIWGESRFREVPLLDASRVRLTIGSISVVSGRWVLNMVKATDGTAGTIAGLSTDDASGAGLNGVEPDNVVYVEGVTVTDATLQGLINTNLNGSCHEVKARSGSALTLHTTTSATATSVAVSAGDVHKVRPSRSNTYSTPNAVAAYDADYDKRPDDPDALTSWRIVLPLLYNDSTTQECYPAWVANRQRDFGDGLHQPTAVYMDVEGLWTRDDKRRGASRREQRQLPYRTNSEAAQDRIILAAPGYGCMFQIPLKVPIDPDNWPSTPDLPGYGIAVQSNDIYDKPRALGIPKARLIDSPYTPAAPSPGIFQPGAQGFNFNAVPIASGSPEFGLAAGEYLVSIAFEDEALGEEGLASEPITVTIPANDYAYTIAINYIHPGYVMPECLALKCNVYIAPPGETAMAYYTSFPLGNRPATAGLTVYFEQSYDTSSKYGLLQTSPDDPKALYGHYELPMLGDGSDISAELDAERLAPQSASMPRGSEACRYIRGVLLAGGNTGNEGGSLQLWAGIGSLLFGTNAAEMEPNELIIRAHGQSTAAIPGSATDGGSAGSTLGTAGRYFPDAYSGIDVTSLDLFPSGATNQTVDRVVNPRTIDLNNPGSAIHHNERLQLIRDIFDRTRTAGSSPTTVSLSRPNRTIWYRMPKGQLQIGDPGAPSRSSKAAIQFIDPNRGDDITAIGQLAGSALICSRRETYSMSWYRVPGGEVPQLISNEHGCIAANSMVEFDGGVAWLGERGPVAMGGTLQYVGADVQEDFFGSTKRYLHDSRGMMRHSWGCHDATRGIVMWGLITSDNDLSITYQGNPDTTWTLSTDEAKSRFPCNEVLVWSYRANAFSTWVPPQPIFWMRQVRVADGSMVTAYLAEDGNLYYLNDAALNGEDTTIVSTYIGAETMDNLSVQGVQMRYTLYGTGTNEADIKLLKSDFGDDGSVPNLPLTRGATSDWQDLGSATLAVGDDETWRLGQRRRFTHLGVDAEEVAVKIVIRGTAQARIADIALEVQ